MKKKFKVVEEWEGKTTVLLETDDWEEALKTFKTSKRKYSTIIKIREGVCGEESKKESRKD